MTLPIKPLFLPALLAAALFLAPAAVRADEPPLPPDSVTLSLSAEGWVEAERARVRVAVDAALSGGEVGGLRAKLKGTLSKLVPDADWHVTDFDRAQDKAGLERWHLEAEARVKESGLDGIYDRAKELSRPGEQVTVVAVDFTPTVAEREKVMGDLRAQIYAQAKDEIARLAAVFPERKFRLREAQFGFQGPRPLPMMKTMQGAPGMAMEAAPAPTAIGVSEYVQLTATVVLAAAAPENE